MERPRRKRKPELAPGQSIHVRWPENGRDYKATVRKVAAGKVKVVYRDESYEDLNLELASDRDRIVEGSGSGAQDISTVKRQDEELKTKKEKTSGVKRKRNCGGVSATSAAAAAAKPEKEAGCITMEQMTDFLSQRNIYPGVPLHEPTDEELQSLVWERVRRIYKGKQWTQSDNAIYSWCPAKKIDDQGPEAIRAAMHARPFIDPGALGFRLRNGAPLPVSVQGQFCFTQQFSPNALKTFFDGILGQVCDAGFDIGTSFGPPAEPTEEEWKKIEDIGGVSGRAVKQIGRYRQNEDGEWAMHLKQKHLKKGLHDRKPKEAEDRDAGPSVTIFMHPGKEEIVVEGNIKVQASVAAVGDRRYQQFSGSAKYLDFTGESEKEVTANFGMLFWAEHSGPGRVKYIQQDVKLMNKDGLPKYVIEPLRDERLPDTMQIRDNDPSVLGGWNYTLCRQGNRRALGNLNKGSIILFVSTVNKRIVLDTCFVVGKYTNVSA
jgi:hypothetical protein